MDAIKKARFEQLMVVVLLAMFAFTVKGVMGQMGAPQPPQATAASLGGTGLGTAFDLALARSSQTELVTPKPGVMNVLTPSAELQYTAETFRDPFTSLLPTPDQALVMATSASPEQLVAATPPPLLTIQGIVWGRGPARAVIDGDVYGVGDRIQNARIVGIDRHGVSIAMEDGRTFRLVPRNPQERLAQQSTTYEYDMQ